MKASSILLSNGKQNWCRNQT